MLRTTISTLLFAGCCLFSAFPIMLSAQAVDLRIDVEEGADGFLGIGKEDDKYILVKTDPLGRRPAMAPGERELYEELFRGRSRIELEQENHGKLAAEKARHKGSLELDYKQHYFKFNGLLNVPAILLLIATAVVSLSQGPSVFSILTIVLMAVTTIIFAVIMKRPTLRGRKLLDEIMGFQDYLVIAIGSIIAGATAVGGGAVLIPTVAPILGAVPRMQSAVVEEMETRGYTPRVQ